MLHEIAISTDLAESLKQSLAAVPVMTQEESEADRALRSGKFTAADVVCLQGFSARRHQYAMRLVDSIVSGNQQAAAECNGLG